MREQGRRHWRRQWVIRPQGVLRVVGHSTWMVVPVAINQVHCWADSVVVVKRMHDRNAKPACDVRQVQTVPGEVTDVNEVDRMAHQQRPPDRLVLGTDMRGEGDGCSQQVAIHSFVPAGAKVGRYSCRERVVQYCVAAEAVVT